MHNSRLPGKAAVIGLTCFLFPHPVEFYRQSLISAIRKTDSLMEGLNKMANAPTARLGAERASGFVQTRTNGKRETNMHITKAHTAKGMCHQTALGFPLLGPAHRMIRPGEISPSKYWSISENSIAIRGQRLPGTF